MLCVCEGGRGLVWLGSVWCGWDGVFGREVFLWFVFWVGVWGLGLGLGVLVGFYGLEEYWFVVFFCL